MKHIFKTFFIVIGTIFLMPRCEEVDDLSTQIPNETKLIVKMSTGEHLRASNNYIFEKLQAFSNEKSLSNTENAQNFTLNLENVQIIEKDYYTQYTVLADHPDSNVNLVNYMLLVYDDGTEFQYLIKYPITINDDGMELDYAQATMEQIDGNIILQTESGIGGTRPCLDSVPELIDTQEVYTCTYTTCSGNERHEWGDDSCPCMITVPECTRASQECGWETVNIWSCTGSGTSSDGNDYSDAGGGSGNDDPNMPPDEEEPIETIPVGDLNVSAECDKINAFIAANETFRSTSNNFNNDLDKNYEKAALKIASPSQIATIEGTPNNPEIKLPPIPSNLIIEGFVHTHYETNTTPEQDTYSVYSMTDLQAFAGLANNNNINGNFVALLATGKGTHYAVTINDTQKFLKFFNYKLNENNIPTTLDELNKFLDSKELYQKLNDKYYEANDAPIKEENTDNNGVLVAFLKMLNESDMGITAFKSDPSFQNFTHVSFDSTAQNNIKETPCN